MKNEFVIEGEIEGRFEDPELYRRWREGQDELEKWMKEVYDAVQVPEN